jgi:CubicO group peptidase (beta-lactamase class C family)
MRTVQYIGACLLLAGTGCTRSIPTPWNGPRLTQPRAQLTVDTLLDEELPPFVDTSFLARPDWAEADPEPFVGTLELAATPLEMDFPQTRALYSGEDLSPALSLDLVSHQGQLIPLQSGLIATSADSDTLWDVLVGTGAVWREPGDQGWSRASFPLDLVDRYFNQVRNCVVSFVYRDADVSSAYVQCSQETADADDQQLGNLRAIVPATLTPKTLADADDRIAAHADARSDRLPTRPLSEWDVDDELAATFDEALLTRASTSVGAVYVDGTLYVHPAHTRHGPHPYPSEMHHGVYSVTKSLVGALSMFYVAQRYGEAVFDAQITDHVPELADRPEWQGVTLSDALNMSTGTNGGEAASLLYEPLVLADTTADALANIAQLGDAPEAPGVAFRYATTNTFLLSVALQSYVEEQEGPGVLYWDRLREEVLEPIGAEGLDVLLTRDDDPSERIPTLGFGARPTLDQAAKIALLIANEGRHEGEQLLHRGKVREALGRTEWEGLRIDARHRYRHGFWSRSIRAGGCRFEVPFMQGYGSNHILLLPSGAIVFRFMDEGADNVERLVRQVERLASSCD